MYDPAMAIADQAAADEYFELLAERRMRLYKRSRQEAERVERINLGYYAGYFGNETRERVERLFRCAEPVFGSLAEKGQPTAEQALLSGVIAAITGTRGTL